MSVPEAPSRTHPFVTFLESLSKREDRAALAILRRAIAAPPGHDLHAAPIVQPWIRESATRWEADTFFAVAALYASHPQPGGTGNFGAAMQRVQVATGAKSTEQRFVALLEAHSEDLWVHMRHAVSLARSREVPLDWHQLLRDLLGWRSSERYVQRRWARSFWAAREEANDTNDAPIEEAR